MNSYRYKLLIAYDGTNFSGWQVQPGVVTIQELLQSALSRLLQAPTFATGSGRTDAGVHALGQVAHFNSETPLNPDRFTYSLNGLLPKEIRIRATEPCDPHFHARYSAIAKTYTYTLDLSPYHNPFHRLYSLHIRRSFDLALLKDNLHYFVGTHDFTSFTNSPLVGSVSRDPIRTLHHLKIEQQDSLVILEFYGNGFLYKMVRNIVGTLIEQALGFPHDIRALFAAKDRRLAGATAPPHGLLLKDVSYSI